MSQGLDSEGDDALEPNDGETVDEATVAEAPAARRKSVQIPAATPGRSVHSQPTQSLPAARGPGATPDESSMRTTASTPVEALRIDEVERTRIFLKTCMLIVVSVVVALQILRGDPMAKKAVYVGCAVAATTMMGLLWHIRDPDNYSVRKVTLVGYSLLFCAYTGVYYWGIYSPAPAIILMGIYFFSLGGSGLASAAIYITCALVQAGLSVAMVTGLLTDRGMIQASEMTAREQLITQLVVQMLFACAFLIARASRKATVDAIEELERAVRAVSAREALLLEARQDLDRALQVGGPGRFSEQRLGSYVLGNLIGRGGMGEVYDARHADNGEPAAVKLLHPHALGNPDHVARFIRETEVAGKLRSPHVVSVLEVGRTDGEVPYLAMELLRGNDLAYHLRKRRKLAPKNVIELVRQVGDGLEVARAAGIVHRDIKPQNLFLAESEGGRAVWKVLDFGVSKLADHGGTLTKGHVVGTPGYMAPEQAQGKLVDHRADLYALAAIAYRALTGRPPFTGKDVPTTLYDVVYKMPKQPSELVHLHGDVDLVLAIGLAKKPAERFDSGRALADALDAAIQGQLADELRHRAGALLSAHWWGTRL